MIASVDVVSSGDRPGQNNNLRADLGRLVSLAHREWRGVWLSVPDGATIRRLVAGVALVGGYVATEEGTLFTLGTLMGEHKRSPEYKAAHQVDTDDEEVEVFLAAILDEQLPIDGGRHSKIYLSEETPTYVHTLPEKPTKHHSPVDDGNACITTSW